MAVTPQQILDTYKGIIQRGLDEFVSKGIRDAIANGLQYVYDNAGSAGVANDHIFTSAADRDNYFNPDRLNELQSGTPVFVQTGTASAPVVMLQVWTGVSSPPTYDNTNWENNGDLSLSRYFTFNPLAQAGQGELQSSVPLFAPILRANTGTLQLDNAIDIESNTDSICIVDNARSERHQSVQSRFTLTEADSNPRWDRRLTPDIVDVSMLGSAIFGDGSFFLTTISDSNVFAFILIPRVAGMATLTVHFGPDDTGVILVSPFNFEFTDAMVDNETTVFLPNCVRIKPGEDLCFSYTGPNLAGNQYSGDPTFGNQLVPFFRIRRHPIVVTPMASQEYVDNAITDGNVSVIIEEVATQTYTVLDAQRNDYIRYTGTAAGTWTLPAATGLASGWGFYLSSATQALTLNRAGTDTIDGGTSIVLNPLDTLVVARSSASTFVTYRIDGNALRLQGIAVSATAPTNGQVLTYDSANTIYAPATPTVGTAFSFEIQSIATQAYTVLSTDRANFLGYTGASVGAWILPLASSLTDGFGLYITAIGANVVLTRSGTDTIDAGTSVTINIGETYVISRSSTSTYVTQKIDGNATRIQNIAVSSTAPTNGQILKYSNTNSQYEPADDDSGMLSVNYGATNIATATYTVVSSDRGQYLRYTGATDATWTLPLASGLTNGFGVFLSTNTNQITVGRSGTDTIDGGTSFVIPIGASYLFARSSATTYISYRIDGNAVALQGVAISTTAPTNGQILKYSSANTQYEPVPDDSGGMGSVNFGINEQVGTYTILVADRGQYVRYTGASNGAWTVPAATTFADGFGVFISTNAFQLTLTRSGADTINGVTSVVIPPRSTYLLSRASSTTYVTYVVDGNALSIQGTAVSSTAPSDGQLLSYVAASSEYQPIDNVDPSVTSLHSFTIAIPARVDIGTALGTRAVSYSVTNYSHITALQLQIGGVNNQAVTIPTTDGPQSVNVDLSGVDTSSATTLVFRLQANGTINSNSQTVNVAAPVAQEMLYWDVEVDNVASTFDFANAESQDAFSGNISIPTFTGNQYLKIAYPATEPAVTQLLIGGVDQLGAFTLASDALTIGGDLYDVLVSNNALDGAIVSGTVVTIIR